MESHEMFSLRDLKREFVMNHYTDRAGRDDNLKYCLDTIIIIHFTISFV